jgi:hypothetical protein
MIFSSRAGVTQLVECDLAKVDVAGSNPVSRSIFAHRIRPMMKRLAFLSCAAVLAAVSLFAQDYKLESIASGPPDVPAAIAGVMQTQGYRVVGPKGPWCEIWFRRSIPQGPKPSDDSVAFSIPQGTFLGILRFPGQGADRRDQVIKAGVYTLRYSNYPVDGAHQGVAPQRDFALLTPVAADADPNATPDFKTLVQWSLKASNTTHPAVLSIEPPAGTTFPLLGKEGDSDWVLSVKVGELPLAIILVGKTQA